MDRLLYRLLVLLLLTGSIIGENPRASKIDAVLSKGPGVTSDFDRQL